MSGTAGRHALKWKTPVAIALVVGVISLLITFALRRGVEAANRSKCAKTLQSIGQAILLYENENRGAMPDAFTTLLWAEDLVPEVFCCPSANVTPARSIEAYLAAPDDSRHVSYVYCGAGLTSDAPRDAVIAFEPLSNHGHGANALFGDGHVEFLSKAAATAIERQFKSGTRPVRVP